MLSRPDVLVLGSGGVLGEAWMLGVLAGIEEASGFDLRDCEAFVGTSAGAIVASRLVAGRKLRKPQTTGTELERPPTPTVDDGFATAAIRTARRASAFAFAAGAPFAPLALGLSAPGGALLRAALLQTLPRPTETLDALHDEVQRSGARFDGRLRVIAVDRRSGRRVAFGSPRAPKAAVADAVQASCAVPWLFAPVRIGDREYVDGGVWSATNLDAAPAGRDTHVLCLNPTAGISGEHTLVSLARGYARSAVSLESLALRQRGAAVQTVAPDAHCAAAMGADFMDREPRARVLAAGYRQGIALI